MATQETLEIGKELYTTAVKGNIELLDQLIQNDDKYLLRKTYENNSIIHIATRHEQHDFIQAVLSKIPNNNNQIVSEENSFGNTPLHIAAEIGNLSIVKLLYNYSSNEGNDEKKPWRMKNSKGNTPVHVAIIHDNVKVARFLLENDVYLACVVNDSKEAPLHLAIKHHMNCSDSEAIKSRLRQPSIGGGGVAFAMKYAPGESMSSMINYLIEKQSCVTCWPDAKGLTPLHRAAYLSIPYNLQIIRSILYHCPQSSEVCDSFGKTVLHLLVGRLPSYQEGKSLLNCNDIYSLRNYQDSRGNTPLHIAANNKDIDMIRALLDSSAKLSVINKEGVSAASLIQQQNLLEMLTKRKMKLEESEAAVRGDITFLRDKMSKLGVDYFLLSRDSEGRNILHKLMHIESGCHIIQDDFVDFIQQILASFPALICQTDINGDTPIHVLVQNHPDTTLRKSRISTVLLELFNQCIIKLKEEASTEGSGFEDIVSPWLVQNVHGNAPLHEALIAHNTKCSRRLLEYDLGVAGLVNKSKQAPLHLLARFVTDEHFQKEDVESMVNAKPEASLWLDKDGLTPVLIAFQVGNVFTATELCNLSPTAAGICNASGQTFWHLLMNHPSGYFLYRLLQNSALRKLLRLGDNEKGNTPLHLAIEGNRFDLVKDFLHIWRSERKSLKSSKDEWLVDLLHISNKAGKTPADLIGESPCLPSHIERSIWDRNEMIGVRSVWGVPTTEMNTYVNTIGIIAALLTTITFTAAFSVPGGLIQDTGTPLLIGKTAFQIFLVSDVTAMCLSMMVLFCLLWIMATSDRRNSVMILDFSISLLLGSFFATLLTFMAGLYATTFPVRPWIAIVTLVMCSLLMLLVHKCLVIRLLIPFGKAIMIFFRMFWKLDTTISRSSTKVWRSIGSLNTRKRNVGGHHLLAHQPSLNNV